jgi:alkylation response protein AidB-like acyl-CoA dehydrogenase
MSQTIDHGISVLAAGRSRVAAAFADAVESGRLDLPLPGGGRTRERWAALADLAGQDLSLARLAEGHADALAILAELGAAPPPAGTRWGVWAAQPPGPGLTARRTGDGWRLDGTKQYCSGARSCTDAVVTATAAGGDRLFAASTADLRPVPGTWPATGMAASDTLDVRFTDIAAEPLGDPGQYTSRPGFAHGGAGVAACWYGGAGRSA